MVEHKDHTLPATQELALAGARQRGTFRHQAMLVRLARLMVLTGTNLDSYFDRVRSIPMLTKEEEQTLVILVEKGNQPGASEREVLAGHEASLRLVFHNLRFAAWAARVSMSKFLPPPKKRSIPKQEAEKDEATAEESETRDQERLRRSSRITNLSRFAWDRLPLADRVQEATLGLLESVEGFRSSGNAAFITYAAYAISRRITTAVLLERYRYGDDPAGGTVNLSSAEGMAKVQAIAIKLRRLTGHEPSVEMIASDAEIGRVAVGLRFQEAATCPRYTLEALYSGMNLIDPTTDELMQPGDLIWEPDAPNGHMFTTQADLYDEINMVLRTLSERQAGVIRLRFGLRDNVQRTLDEIGQVYGLTRDRVRQIESKTMSALRHPSRSDRLRDYLGLDEYWSWYGCGVRTPADQEPATRTIKNLETHPELYLAVPALAGEARERLRVLVGYRKAQVVEEARIEAEWARQEAAREARRAARAQMRAERAARYAQEWIDLEREFDFQTDEERVEFEHERDLAQNEFRQADAEAVKRRREAAVARSVARYALRVAETRLNSGLQAAA